MTNPIQGFSRGDDDPSACGRPTPMSVRSFRSRAVSSIGWVAADKWGNRFIALGVLIVLGRLLDAEDFGLVALTVIIVSIGAIIVDAGFSKALVQKDQLEESDRSTAFWFTVATSCLLVVGMIVFAGPIAHFLGDQRLVPILRWLSIAVIANAISSVPAALLEREFGFRKLAIRRLLGTAVGGISAIVAALAGLGVWSLVIQTIFTSVVSLLSLWTTSPWRPHFVFSSARFRLLWGVGGSVLGIELIGVVASQADRLVIGTVLGAEVLGYYFLAMRVVSILVELFSSVFSGISLTAFSRLQKQPDRLVSLFYRLVEISSNVAIPVFTLAALTAPVMIPLVFGHEWNAAVVTFQILCILGALNAIGYFDRSVLIASGNSSLAFLLTFGQGILGVALIVFSSQYGVVAVAIAVVARQYLFWPVRLLILRVAVNIRPVHYLVRWLRPFLFSALSVVIIAAMFWRTTDPIDAAAFYVGACVVVVVTVSGLGTREVLRGALNELGGSVGTSFSQSRMDT
ncbi:probable polysaccharide transport protein [Rhodococcus wratislaviensis]|uniref:Probable polysaccharide transport protein n=1 Tax=Rhodococcus wratislaviensis TaxID=44752 RepID=A0A402C7H5_RHOWR|nr:lipopolysaccharide biosynthesis protein [Rhodococcus wratislaviensis]GCE39561.1 probable polysaccharide transport protein [Rhodococcus wratislaviensis]